MPDDHSTPANESREVTQLLLAWGRGDEAALAALTPLVYEELRRLARRYMAGERVGHTLQPTALVNEAFLRMVDVRRVQWQNRAHFIAMSARLMRRILVDFARSRESQKRGGGAVTVSLGEAVIVSGAPSPDLIAVDEALETLSVVDDRKAKIIELRFFGGLTVEETAEALKISPGTVMRDWKFAKAWLAHELAGRRRG